MDHSTITANRMASFSGSDHGLEATVYHDRDSKMASRFRVVYRDTEANEIIDVLMFREAEDAVASARRFIES